MYDIRLQKGCGGEESTFLAEKCQCYIRKGNESVAANSHELYKLVLKGSHRSWDSLVTNEPRAKYSFAYLQTEYNERSGAKWEENLLLSFGLVTENGFMTNAGLLFADICPIRQSRLFCTRWDGTEKGDTINDSEYQGNLLINLRMAKGKNHSLNQAEISFSQPYRT